MSAMFDRTMTIQAPLHLVWQEVHKFAECGKIIIERIDQLLVATQLKFGYVYWLQENPDGSTNLRVFIDKAEQVEEKLNTNPNIPAALTEISVQEHSSGSELLNTLLGVFFQPASPELNGETALEQAKKKAEQGAKRVHWAPRPVLENELPIQPPVIPIAQVVAQPQPVAPGLAPFNPFVLIAMSALFNFGAAGVLAGLNWKRLSKPERMWPTILISLAGMFILITAIFFSPVVGKLMDEFQLALYSAIGTFLCLWQFPYFNRWSATYGKAKTGLRGFLTGLGIGVGTALAALLYSVGMAVVQEVLATGF